MLHDIEFGANNGGIHTETVDFRNRDICFGQCRENLHKEASRVRLKVLNSPEHLNSARQLLDSKACSATEFYHPWVSCRTLNSLSTAWADGRRLPGGFLRRTYRVRVPSLTISSKKVGFDCPCPNCTHSAVTESRTPTIYIQLVQRRLWIFQRVSHLPISNTLALNDQRTPVYGVRQFMPFLKERFRSKIVRKANNRHSL